MPDYYNQRDDKLSLQERGRLLENDPEALEITPDDLNNFFTKLPGHPARVERLETAKSYPEDKGEHELERRSQYYSGIDQAFVVLGFDLQAVAQRVEEFAKTWYQEKVPQKERDQALDSLFTDLKLAEVYKHLRRMGYKHHDLYK